MALAFADIKTILRSRLSETTASAWADSELQDYIYLAEHEILQLLPSDSFFDIQQVEEETESGVNDGFVALPATALIEQLVNLEIYPSNDQDPVTRLRLVEPGLSTEHMASASAPVAWFEDGKLYFTPDVDPAVTQTVKFRFVPAPTEASILLPDRFASLIVSFAYALAIAREDVGQAAIEKNEFYQRIKMLETKDFGINKLGRSI